MKKLKLNIDTLVVESFAIPGDEAPRGTVEGMASCNTCEDINCSAACTGGTCDPGNTLPPGSGVTACGPTMSDANFGCSTGGAGCRTYYYWTGCDYSCVWGPCESFEECSLPC
jgi:hypothetical protein